MVLGAALWLVAGVALAAENEVRLPVEKTARIAPVGELPAEPEKPAKPEKKAASAPEAKKTVAKKPEAVQPEAAPSGEAQAETPAKAKAPRAPAKKPPKTAEAQPEAAPSGDQPAAQPAKPARPVPPPPPPPPAPKIDPKALEMPPAPAGPRVATPLPGEGQWVGDVDVEFQADRVILHVATSGPVERVTWFNQKDPKEPRKLALDLRGPWRKKGGPVLRFETGPVKAVVVGEHPDRLRLAVEFREGAVKPDLEPVVDLGPQGATLTIPLAVTLRR